jgi:hypothetical protein
MPTSIASIQVNAATVVFWLVILLSLLGSIVFLALGGGRILRLWAREPVGIAVPAIAAALVYGAPQMGDMLAGMRSGNGADDASWHQAGLGIAVFVLSVQGWFWTRAALNARGYPGGRTGWRDRDTPIDLPWQEVWAPRLTLVPATLIAVSPVYQALAKHIPWRSVPWVGVASALIAAALAWSLARGRRTVMVKRAANRPAVAAPPPLRGRRVLRLLLAAPFGRYGAVCALVFASILMGAAVLASDFVNDTLHAPTAALLALSCPVAFATVMLALLRDGADWLLNRIDVWFGHDGPASVAAGDLLGTFALLMLPTIGSHLADTALLGHLYDVRPVTGDLLQGDPVTQRPGVAKAAEDYLACRGGRPSPAIIVAAEGGASRSAAWTLSMLRSLDSRTGGAIGANLFAISSVSGGSLAAVTYLMAQAKAFPDANDKAPSPAQQVAFWDTEGNAAGQWGGPYNGIVELARGDLLAPVVARMFSIDAVIGLPTRGPALEEAFEHHWGSPTSFAMREQAEKGLLALRSGKKCLPHLILNGTDVTTGNRLLTSTIQFGNNDTYLPDGSDPLRRPFSAAIDVFDSIGHDIRASAAVLNSARFPIVSPPGFLRAKSDQQADAEVIDGGVFENYGARAAWELADAIRIAYKDQLTPIVLLLGNDIDLGADNIVGPVGQCFADTRSSLEDRALEKARSAESDRGAPLPELLTSPIGLYNTRAGHAQGEIAILRQRNCPSGQAKNLYHFDLPKPEVDKSQAAPMNWMLDVNTCQFLLGAGRRAVFNTQQANQLVDRLKAQFKGIVGTDGGDKAHEDSVRCHGDAEIVPPWTAEMGTLTPH